MEQAKCSAEITHNHPEGVKGAQAVALAVFMGRRGVAKRDIMDEMRRFYPAFDEPRLGMNSFNETCQGTMPVVFGIIREANSFEEAIRWAVAVGGDSDTIAAIVGSIAEAIWGIPAEMKTQAMDYLPEEMIRVIDNFYDRVG